jgi:hypothetical protein
MISPSSARSQITEIGEKNLSETFSRSPGFPSHLGQILNYPIHCGNFQSAKQRNPGWFQGGTEDPITVTPVSGFYT